MSATANNWQIFSSDQWADTQRTGFDWDAEIAYVPSLSIDVNDCCIQQKGTLHATLVRRVTMANMFGTPEMVQAELIGYFAQASFYPTALLPGNDVSWQATGESHAQLVARDGEHEIRLAVHFGEDDLVDRIFAQSRRRTVERKIIPIMWDERWSQCLRLVGYLTAMSGHVAWLLDPQDFTKRQRYWLGQVESIRYART
jgi:hypothetical protein